jgi:cyclophilin family peptidyl-prolyl cis-trans isomerase
MTVERTLSDESAKRRAEMLPSAADTSDPHHAIAMDNSRPGTYFPARRDTQRRSAARRQSEPNHWRNRMKPLSIRRKALSADRGIELLESRCLLSATFTAQISGQTAFTGQSPPVLNLGSFFSDPSITGTTVLMQTSNGPIPIMLADSTTPITVANFLKYVDSGEYNNTVIHRAVQGFVDQGGGFDTSLAPIPTFGTIQNEPHFSNTRGTVAMAKLGSDPNSATSQWFINDADNSSNLDNQNGGFTVFGLVLYNGMTVADAINNLPTTTLTSQDNESLTDFPVQDSTAPNVPSNFVVVNSVSRVAPLSFSVSVADPTVLTPSLSNGVLALTPTAGATSGTTAVTVTATDLGGGTATSTFNVTVSTGSTLTPVISGKLPTVPLVAGQKISPINTTVKITNNGSSLVSGAIHVDLSLSTDNSGDTPGTSVAGANRNVKLKPGQSTTVPITVKSIPSSVTGTEFLLATVTDPGANTATGVSSGAISLQPPFVDLSGSFGKLTALKAGHNSTITIDVMQNGNIPVNSSLPIDIIASASGTVGAADNIDLGTVAKHVSIKPGKKVVVQLTEAIPAGFTGTHFLIAVIDPNNTLNDTNLTNNTFVSAIAI